MKPSTPEPDLKHAGMAQPARTYAAKDDRKFLVYRQFDEPRWRAFANLRHRYLGDARGPFPSESLPDRLARALLERRAIMLKELLESFELYARVRKRVRRPTMMDLCCGHGLTGLLFALCERSVTRVILTDERRPRCYEQVYAAVVQVGPWVAEKVTFREAPLEGLSARDAEIPRDCGTLIVHGCGSLTDRGLEIGIRSGGPIAAMPCCYKTATRTAPLGLEHALGRILAADIARTYRLHDAGYHVDWSAIPEAITPMNRILVAWHPGAHSAQGATPR